MGAIEKSKGVQQMTPISNKWLEANCDFNRKHRSELPVPCLGDRHYETTLYYFEFERDNDGYHSCLKVDRVCEKSDCSDVEIENRRPDGTIEGGVGLGVVKTVEHLKSLVELLRSLQV